MPFGIEMRMARQIASKYGLDANTPIEKEIFALSWRLRRRADRFSRRWAPHLEAQVEAGVRQLAGWIHGTPSFSRGHKIVRWRPTRGARYVIFSDHHWATSANRQDFFGASGNRNLYLDVLARYAQTDFCLVENGDVEELLVFEPTRALVRRRLQMNQNELERDRRTHRLTLLRRILAAAEMRPLYDALADFQGRGKLLRVAGNHDTDLQWPEFHAELRRRIPGVLKPCDYLFLQSPRAGSAGPKIDFAIAHGHQFDKSTNGRYASRIGETISETMSWAYQGADRTWRWSDGVKAWALGLEAFRGDLVDATYDHSRGNILDIFGALFSNLHSQEAWEALFKHNIAWEYFENADPQEAIDLEVKTGDAFFKFRHLDELRIRTYLGQQLRAAERPVLVLGHSHEVRLFNAPTPGAPGQKACRWYANSGAAGRFENLLWALEIDDGVMRLVSWSRPSPRVGPPARRTWSHRIGGGANLLQAEQTPTPLS